MNIELKKRKEKGCLLWPIKYQRFAVWIDAKDNSKTSFEILSKEYGHIKPFKETLHSISWLWWSLNITIPYEIKWEEIDSVPGCEEANQRDGFKNIIYTVNSGKTNYGIITALNAGEALDKAIKLFESRGIDHTKLKEWSVIPKES